MILSDAGRSLAAAIIIQMETSGNIARYLTSYPDGGGVWTIGVGSTFMPSGRRVVRGDVLTLAQAMTLLEAQIDKWAPTVFANIHVAMTDAQVAVLISFVHQEGTGALPNSVLADMANAGVWERALRQLNGWVIATAGGVRGPQLGIMRRMEAQRRIAGGMDVKAACDAVWQLGTGQLLPLYEAACSDARRYRNGVVTWEMHPIAAATVAAQTHPAAAPVEHPDADDLNAQSLAGAFTPGAQA